MAPAIKTIIAIENHAPKLIPKRKETTMIPKATKEPIVRPAFKKEKSLPLIKTVVTSAAKRPIVTIPAGSKISPIAAETPK